MNVKTILISLLVFALLVLSAAPALAGPAPSSKWGDCVAVLPGQRDDIGGVLTAMNIPYRSITPTELKDDVFLGKLCTLFIASGSAVGSDAAPNVARWVERGGSLYVSGSALEVILAAFPGRLASGGKALPGFVRVELADKGAAAAMGTEITLTIPNEGWTLPGGTGASVHARGRLDSSDSPLIVSFDAGQGWVVFSALNAGSDLPDAQQKLVRYYVIRTLFARDASQAMRRYPAASAAPIEIADTVDPGRLSAEYAFAVRQADDWDAVLLWNEGKRGLTLRGPDGKEVTQQSDTSPLAVPIRNAAPGVWKVYTRGLAAPSANSPFMLVLVPRLGTNLLNGVPTPLQASRDISVLLGNLGLAVAMAVLFALGAWLFKDTLAERKENRALAAASGVAARAGGAVGTLFAPTAWKLPPFVKRAAVALELAVFLALTALVASFLDPHFTPSNARGVGIFAGMLVAFTVVTLVYALAQSATARMFGLTGVFQIRPGYLIVVAVCVLVSRLLDYVPGYVFGLAAGFAVLGALEGARRRDGMLAFVAILAPLAVGLIAWALTIPTDLALRNMAQGQLNATVSGGLTTVLGAAQAGLLLVFLVALWQTFFELFPISGLSGWKLFTGSPMIWFVLMVAAVFMTLHLLVNPGGTALEIPENRALILLVVVLAIYSAAAVGTWLLFNAPRLRGVGASPRRSAVVLVILTILVWLCTCGSGAALAALRYLGPR